METILAIIVVVAGVALAILAIRYVYKRITARIAAERAEAEAEMNRQREATRKWRESMYEKSRASAVKNTSAVPPRATSTKSYTPSYAPSPTQSVQNDDGFLTGVLAGMLIDNAIDSFKHGTDRDTGVTYDRVVERSSSSSWGFDDEDSRKSAASSFSSSDSSSSWDSGSSDSGPSSDW